MKDKKKKAKAALLTTTAAAGILTGALFDTPADLLPDLSQDSVVEELVQSGDDEAPASGEKKRSVPARLRSGVLRLPAAVRMLVGIPLWTVGWVLMEAAGVLLAGVSTPLARLVSWLCLFLAALVTFALATKAAFPKVPFRRIVTPGRAVLLLVCTLLLGLADLALPTVWTGYDPTTQLVWRIGATVLLVVLCGRALVLHGNESRALPPPRTMSDEEIRERARQLADSVSTPRW